MYTQEQKKLINEVLDKLCRYMDKPSTEAIYKRWFVSRVSDFKEKHNLNEPMFEVGKCYKSERGSVMCFTGNVDEFYLSGYGITGDGYYYNNNYWNKNIYTTEIPREEFNKKLLEYAEKNFVGKRVKHHSGKIAVVHDVKLGRLEKNNIFDSRTTELIFCSYTGKFAEIIEEVEEPTIIIKVPKGTNYIVEEV